MRHRLQYKKNTNKAKMKQEEVKKREKTQNCHKQAEKMRKTEWGAGKRNIHKTGI